MPERVRNRAPWAAAILLVAGGCLFAGFEARHLVFNADDWQFILYRRGIGAHVFLAPHAQSLVALIVLTFKVLLTVFGAASYAPFMAALLLVHGIACLLLYTLARRRVGPWAALVPAAILVALGPAWHDLLFATQIGYIGSVAAGLGMVVCLERGDRRGDIAAAALLSVSVLWSSIGLGMLVLAAVLIALERQRTWRRLWVAALPFALYVAWYAAYGVSDGSSNRVGGIPGYLWQALSAGVASVTGLGQGGSTPFLVSTSAGHWVAVVLVGLLVLRLVRGGRLPPLTWAALAAAVALWTAAALAFYPSREPGQSRYQYAAVALLLLAAVSVAPGWRPTWRSGLVLAACGLFAVGSNAVMLHQRARFWTVNSEYTAAEAGALEVARNVVAPDFMPINLETAGLTGRNGFLSVAAAPYFSAIDAYGSIADSPQAILRQPAAVREAADLILAGAERLNLEPARRPLSPGASCRSRATGAGLGEIAVGPGRLWVRVAAGTAAELQLRRFAAAYRFVATGVTAPQYGLPGLEDGPARTLTVPADRSTIPWRMRLVGGRDVRLCFMPLT